MMSHQNLYVCICFVICYRPPGCGKNIHSITDDQGFGYHSSLCSVIEVKDKVASVLTVLYLST